MSDPFVIGLLVLNVGSFALGVWLGARLQCGRVRREGRR